MKKITKVALGLCAIKVSLEATKYISKKWGSGKMSDYIERLEVAAIEMVGKGIEAGKEIAVSKINANKEIKNINVSAEKEIKVNENDTESKESEKILNIIEELSKDNENGKNDRLIQDFYKLLANKQDDKRKIKQEKEKTERDREKTKRTELIVGGVMGGIAITGIVFLVHECINNYA